MRDHPFTNPPKSAWALGPALILALLCTAPLSFGFNAADRLCWTPPPAADGVVSYGGLSVQGATP